jgi:hypothetical protein
LRGFDRFGYLRKKSGIYLLEPEKIVVGCKNQYLLEVLSNRNQEMTARG